MNKVPRDPPDLKREIAGDGEPVEERPRFRAAKIVLWSPFVGLFLLISVLVIESVKQSERLRPPVVISAACVSWLIWIAGFVLGVVLLARSRTRKENIGRAIVGIGFNLLLIAGTGWLTVLGLGERAKMEQLRRRNAEVEATQGAESRYQQAQSNLGVLERKARRLASQGQGDNALIGAASTNLVRRERAIIERFYTAVKPVSTAHLLDMSEVQEKAELDRRRELLEKCIAATKSFDEFYQHMEQEYRETLSNSGVSLSSISNGLHSFHTNMAAVIPLVERINAARIEWATDEIAALDLLKANWGRWEYDEGLNKVLFQDTRTAGEFNRLVKEINRLTEVMQSIQRQVWKSE